MYKYLEIIENYIKDNYDLSEDLIKVKLAHTVRVYKLMIELVEKLNMPDHDKVLALCIALFHDLGRFYELKVNKTMNNRYDHAADSTTILFNEGLIQEFPIDEDEYDLILKAVYYHNKKELPNDLTDREEFFCHLIRDVDKIDIYHVVANDLPKEFLVMPSEKVLEEFYNKELIDILDIKNKSDTIIFYLAFQDQIYFRESLALLDQKGYFDEYINSIVVEHNTLIKDTFDHLVDEAYTHRDDNLYKRRIKRREVKHGRIR